MPPPQEVIEALSAEFPKPKVDSEWLEQCCTWIAEEKGLSSDKNLQEFLKIVNDQLLGSDLRDSMQHGTGLNDISKLSGHLPGPPVLVQIVEITDIGVSAFQLEQIRAAREERILAGVGDEENEEDGDIEVEGEGPMPKYPRGTLHFQVSDGAIIFEAMEYRPIPQLGLGTTKLGYKLQLKGTRFSNGMAFLEPTTVKLIGGSSADLDTEQPELFKMGLFERLGKPLEQVPKNTPPTSRAPLRDISPPPPTLHDDDVDMEPRRRLPATSSFNEHLISTPNDSRPIKALPSYHSRKSTESAELDGSHPNARQMKTIDQKTRQTEEPPYPNAKASGSVLAHDQSTVSSAFPSARPLPSHEKRDSFDFDLLNQIDTDENMPPPRQSTYKGKERSLEKRILNDDSSDYGMDDENDFVDANFLASLDKVEKDALEGKTFSDTQLSKFDGGKRESSRSPTLSLEHATSSFAVKKEIIEIDDDSEEDPDKENAFVPMRHVRRRTEDHREIPRGRSPATSPKWVVSQVSTQRKAKGRVAPDNVIAISDSD